MATSRPRFVPADYRTRYPSPVAEHRGSQTWYFGTGVRPAAHPLRHRIGRFPSCSGCGSEDVLVIAAQHSVHMMSGDAYWDAEVCCQRCGQFTTESFAEN